MARRLILAFTFVAVRLAAALGAMQAATKRGTDRGANQSGRSRDAHRFSGVLVQARTADGPR
jgi:hypothetical protein